MDILIRGMTPDGLCKAAAIDSTALVEEMRRIHNTTPVASAALGRTLTAASMMGDEIKDEHGSITVQIKGDGPLGTILAVSDSCGNVRGYVQDPTVDIPLRQDGKLNVGAAVGCIGILTVIKDIGAKEPFSGKVELLGGEIAEDIAAYYAESEQIPTVCALGVLVDVDYSIKRAGGYIIQLLPGAGDEIIERIERGIAATGSVTNQLENGLTPEQILKAILGEDFVVMDSHGVRYECKCSRERVESALISMGSGDLQQIIDDGKDIEVTCQFCDKIYKFTPEDVKILKDSKKI